MKHYDFKIDLSNRSTMIQSFIEQLKLMRKTTSKPEELEWEIRVYEYVLKDPDNRWQQYRDARGTFPNQIPKREAVKNLGWVIE